MVHVHSVFLILSLQVKESTKRTVVGQAPNYFFMSATCFGPTGLLSRVRHVTRKISLQNVLYILLYYV